MEKHATVRKKISVGHYIDSLSRPRSVSFRAKMAECEDAMEIEVDPSWTKILNEYPISSLPNKLNKRSGKAKHAMFEEIDKELYEEEAKMVTFYTNLQRLHPWIKTLDTFYYDNLGKSEEFKINWHDDPEVWENASDSANSIVIEVLNKNALWYTVTFFVTTGTVRIQGSRYRVFINKHFPILKQILNKILCQNKDYSTGEIPPACAQNDPSVTRSANEETSLKTLETSESEKTEENFLRIENSITETVAKLERAQIRDNDAIVKLVNQNTDHCLKKVTQLIENCINKMEVKKVGNSEESKLEKIEKKLLEMEENCEVFMDKINKRLLNLEETTNVCLKKLEQVQEMCTTPNTSCGKLPNQSRDNPHSYAEAVSNPPSEWQVAHDIRRKSKPKVLLIGTSNVKGILEDKLTPVANMEKVIRYTLKETTDYILSCNEQPNIVVLHSLTNDLTKMEPLVCVENLETLVRTVRHKWENTATIISMTTPRADDILHQTNG